MHLRGLVLSMSLTACAVTAAPNDDRFPDAAYVRFSVGTDPLAFQLRTAPSQPPERGACSMEVRVADRYGLPRDGLSIEVVPFMGAHGHGAAGHPIVSPIRDGRYRIDGLELSMPGFWQLRFEIRGEGIDAVATTTIEVR